MGSLQALVSMFLFLFGCINANANSLLITNTSVVSPERASVLRNTNVLIEGGRIVSVASDVVRTDRVLDGTDKYLIPGLIDSHVHLAGVPGMLPVHEASHPEIAEQAKAQIPRSYLYFGFTTVNDLFSGNAAITNWNQQEIRPDAYFCAGVPLANGYPMAWIPKEQRFNSEAAEHFLYDDRQKNNIPVSVDPESHRPEAIVKRIVHTGAACIKIFYERGFGRLRNLPNPTVEMAQSLVRNAKEKGLPVFLHGNTQQSQEFAVEAGVDVIAHGMWHWKDSTSAKPSDELDSLLDKIVRQNIGYQPTVQVIFGEQEMFNESFFSSSLLAHSAPKALIAWYQSDDGRWMQKNIAANIGMGQAEIDYEKAKQSYALAIERANRVLNSLAKKGARLLFGSDSPSGPIFTQLHGMNGRLEMQRWVEAGVSLEKLFRALTIDNADALGLGEKIGTVQPGKTANLLLLNRSPLKSISAYDEIDAVILHGKVIDRQSLSAAD